MFCGQIDDGCGGTVSCDDCPGGQVCDGNDACCSPTTCEDAGVVCGEIPNGCGGTLSCDGCPDGQGCDDNDQCVECAEPTCSDVVECGTVSDACGDTIECGGGDDRFCVQGHCVEHEYMVDGDCATGQAGLPLGPPRHITNGDHRQ